MECSKKEKGASIAHAHPFVSPKTRGDNNIKTTQKSKKYCVKVLFEGREFVICNKPAMVLRELINHKNKGRTALELSNTWALRLSEYIRQLRHDYGIHIEMVREDHEGGWHGRYFLRSDVKFISVI